MVEVFGPQFIQLHLHTRGAEEESLCSAQSEMLAQGTEWDLPIQGAAVPMGPTEWLHGPCHGGDTGQAEAARVSHLGDSLECQGAGNLPGTGQGSVWLGAVWWLWGTGHILPLPAVPHTHSLLPPCPMSKWSMLCCARPCWMQEQVLGAQEAGWGSWAELLVLSRA